MGTFQILMFAATLFFIYQIYRHVENLEDAIPPPGHNFDEEDSPLPPVDMLIEEADEAYAKGDAEKARTALLQAYEEDDTNPEILNKLAFVTAKTGDALTAVKLYKRSLAIDENDDLTHNALASLYRSQGEFESAQEHYEKALRIDGAYPQTYFNYGNLLSDMGNIRKAEEMYRRALDLQSDFPEAHEALISLQGKE
jgi:tetratricopeptide (TPR) repeat protein